MKPLAFLFRASLLFAAALAAVACGGSSTETIGGGGGDAGAGAPAPSATGPSGSGSGSGSTSGTGTGSGTSAGATCASTFTTLCEQSFTCSKDACRFALETDAGATIGSMSWKTVEECKGFWLYTCQVPGGVRADFDYDACTSAIAAAACVSTPQGDALVYPAVCNVNAGSH